MHFLNQSDDSMIVGVFCLKATENAKIRNYKSLTHSVHLHTSSGLLVLVCYSNSAELCATRD
jgi:hypothetical protein